MRAHDGRKGKKSPSVCYRIPSDNSRRYQSGKDMATVECHSANRACPVHAVFNVQAKYFLNSIHRGVV